uniref:Uncharacterized protein n=1 Tax=Rhipicephalus zambeziensis TaxID=60191 RepID=A0A224YH77_9ACAR
MSRGFTLCEYFAHLVLRYHKQTNKIDAHINCACLAASLVAFKRVTLAAAAQVLNLVHFLCLFAQTCWAVRVDVNRIVTSDLRECVFVDGNVERDLYLQEYMWYAAIRTLYECDRGDRLAS